MEYTLKKPFCGMEEGPHTIAITFKYRNGIDPEEILYSNIRTVDDRKSAMSLMGKMNELLSKVPGLYTEPEEKKKKKEGREGIQINKP